MSTIDGNQRFTLEDLLYLMERLRDPQSGCPWDLAQDFASIVPHTLEESYELADTIERNDMGALRDELGDLMFQVIFYSQLAREQALFAFEDVIDNLVHKLLRRHPHVFPDGCLRGAATGATVATEQVKQRWEAIKQQERAAKQQHSAMDDIPLNLPALSRANKLQKRAAREGFDWDALNPIFAKLQEEIGEVQEAIAAGDEDGIEDELGDLLFCCVNLVRHLKRDPEATLRRSNRKFERRFRHMEAALAAEGRGGAAEVSPATLEALWERAKADEVKS